MCWMAAAAIGLTVASTAVTIAGQVQQQENAESVAKANEKLAKAEATQLQAEASGIAGRIQTEAGEDAAAQRAALSSSGFDVNQGDAVSVVNATVRRGVVDANAASGAGAWR